MPNLEKINILIVEDNEDDLFFIRKTLSHERYKTHEIRSGTEALSFLLNPEIRPDIVLLDNRLPGLNGLEVLSKLEEKKNDYSFIFLTVDNTIETVIQAMKTGALDFIVKSVNIKNELPDKIEKIYKIHKTKIEKLESDANLLSLIESGDDSVWSVDKNFRFIIFNQNFKNAFDNIFNIELKKGTSSLEMLSEKKKKFWKLKYEKVLLGEKLTFDYEFEINNVSKYFEISLNPITIGNNITGISAISRNITERKTNETKLKEQNEELIRSKKQIEENQRVLTHAETIAKVGSWKLDINTFNIKWSDEMYNIFGLDKNTDYNLLEQGAGQIHPDDREKAWKNSEKAIKEKKSYELYYRITLPNGYVKFVFNRGIPVADKDGIVNSYIGVFLDITEIRLKEQEIIESKEKTEKSERLLKKMAENYPNSYISIIEKDLTTGFSAGQEFKRQNLNPDDFVGLSLKQVFGEKEAIVKENYLETFKGVEKSFELFINNQHQLYKTVPLFDDKNEVSRILVVVENITENKLAEQKISDNEKQLRMITDNIPAFIAYIDSDLLYQFVNKKYEEFYTLPKSEIIGKHIKSIIGENNYKHALEKVKRVFLGESMNYENPFTINKRKYHFITSYIPDIKDDGNIKGFYLLSNDITERKQTEEELIKAKERAEENEINLVRAQEIGKIGHFDFNPLSKKVKGSRELFKIFGVEKGHEIFDAFVKAVHPDDADLILPFIDNTIKTGEPYDVIHRVKHKNGKVLYVHAKGEISHQKNERKMLGTVQDITSQKKIEEELIEAKEKAEENEEKYKKLFERDSDAIFIYDPETTNIIDANNSTSEMYRYNKEELIGKSVLEFSAQVKESASSIKKNKNDGDVNVPYRLHVKKDGTVFPVDVSGYSITLGGKNLMFAVSKDITERFKAEEELITAKEKAEESNRLKTEFLNNMSHEIRTPLNGIMGFSQYLTKPDISKEKQINCSNIILNNSRQLLKIIEDILEISLLEKGDVKYSEREVCFNDLLLNLFSIYDIKAKENKTPLFLKKSLPDKQSTIYTDEDLLRKILSHLIDNAIKYTNEGFIDLSYQKIDNELVISVSDTGIGIDTKKTELIFKRFSQEDKSLSKKYGGLGLGLSLAKENADLIGGRITLESKKGKGSTFYLTIPYRPVHSNKEATISNEESGKKFCILIAEDEEVNYLYFETLLFDDLNFNCKLYHAKNGQEAVDMCKNYPEIELVLMDLKMPELNGFEATAQIKKLRNNLPVIAQTAYSTNEERKQAKKAGCDDFISKPIQEKTLFNILNEYI